VGTNRPFDAFPSVEHQGWSPADRWFQVAPGGDVVAFWSAPTGLVVLGADGTSIWRLKGSVGAFRFSAGGDRLAIATARDIQSLHVARRSSRQLAPLAGVDWLSWTNAGLVARTRSAVELVGEDGRHHALAKVRAGAPIAARGYRLVLFESASMRELDLA